MLKTLFGKRLNGRFPGEDFVLAEGEREGLPAIALINRAYKRYSFTSEYPWHVEIEIAMQDTTDLGLPTSAEADALNALEDYLEEEMTKAGAFHQIARQTWNHVRMIDYYVEVGPAAKSLLSRLADSGSTTRPFTVKVEHDDDWSICEGFFQNL